MAAGRPSFSYRPEGVVQIEACDEPAMAETHRRPATVTRFCFVARAATIDQLPLRCAAATKEESGVLATEVAALPFVRDCGSVECQPASGWRSRASGRFRSCAAAQIRLNPDECFVAKAIARRVGAGRLLAVESDRPAAAATAAPPGRTPGPP